MWWTRLKAATTTKEKVQSSSAKRIKHKHFKGGREWQQEWRAKDPENVAVNGASRSDQLPARLQALFRQGLAPHPRSNLILVSFTEAKDKTKQVLQSRRWGNLVGVAIEHGLSLSVWMQSWTKAKPKLHKDCPKRQFLFFFFFLWSCFIPVFVQLTAILW